MAINHIILHAGMSKTGSTSIQHTLFANRWILRKNGFLYLNEWGGISQNNILLNLFSQKLLMNYHLNANKSEMEIAQANQKNVKTLIESAERSDCQTLLLSSEILFFRLEKEDCRYMKEFLKTVFPAASITVLICVRHPVNHLVSLYQQLTAAPGFPPPAIEHIRRYAKNIFRKPLEGFLDVFGSDLRVFSFENAVADQDGLVGHFLKQSGFPQESLFEIEEHRSNEGRSLEAIEFFDALETELPTFSLQDGRLTTNPLRLRLDTRSLERIPGERFDLPIDFKRELCSLVEEDSIWLKETFGIDYTNPVLQDTHPTPRYGSATLDGFEAVFEQLTHPVKTFF